MLFGPPPVTVRAVDREALPAALGVGEYRLAVMNAPRRLRLAVAPLLACAALTVVSCAGRAVDPPTARRALAQPVVASPLASSGGAVPLAPNGAVPPSPPAECRGAARDAAEWSCTQQQRFAAARAYISRHVSGQGYVGVVFTDRQTGHTWRFGPTQHEGWTASTIKLAIATDLLRRHRGGQLTLSAADRHDMATMLNFSDEQASDRLWAKFGGEDMLARFRSEYGMVGLHFVPGFTTRTYWGFVKCTTDDLAALASYVFTRLHAADQAYLVSALRGVAPNQQWGIWAAGATQRPGNKDGWSYETDSYGKHWVTNTVGFAGPEERYLIAVMYQVAPSGTLDAGVHTVSDVVALLFGAPIPAPVTVPAPDG
ncbi:MAG: tat pathway signal sequence [Pseudonocardiales bacterium]|nr:tat pathway signal sequence [Pseudonocardiales bacterium]